MRDFRNGSFTTEPSDRQRVPMSASLIGHLGSSAFRPSTTTAVSMSLTGSCFSSESAPRPFHHGNRERGGTIYLADEIVSGLDVSTQAQVLRLLKELTSEMRLALAFISHDLSVVRSICQRVVVMREGRVVEEGPCDRLFAAPGAAYTRMLIDAIPLPVVDPGWLSRGAALEAAGIIDDVFH